MRNGRATNLWLTPWHFEDSLVSFCSQTVLDDELGKMVSDYWISGRGWDWNILQIFLPDNIQHKLSVFLISEDPRAAGNNVWRFSSSRIFTVKSAYEALMQFGVEAKDNLWSLLWKVQVPQRIRVLLWLIGQDKIMCNMERFKRGFSGNP